MERAHIDLTIRSVDNEQRRVEGWATRPEEDRMGDLVIPEGAVYKLPLPFLLDHDHSQAVGQVDRVEVTSAGIRFSAFIAKITEPGAVKDACDAAWSLIRNGLRKSVSIGFRPLKSEPIATGTKFTRWEWLELSAVSIPALASADITTVKGMPDTRTTAVPLVKPIEPGVKLVRPQQARFYVP